ncbi:MAG: metal-sensitive transcriptional regulator [bacterium]
MRSSHSREGDRREILWRLRDVEGQIRGIQRMVAEDRYCIEILKQIAAARGALNRVGMLILEGHSRNCIAAAVDYGDARRIADELTRIIARRGI